MEIKKAVRSQARLRAALIGPSGSGKSFTALTLAKHLQELLKTGPIGAIDTEHESLSLYADLVDFDTINIDTYSPDTYIKALRMLEETKHGIVIIDSMSHAHMGKDGVLEMADKNTLKGGNSFTAWRGITKLHDRLMDAIVASPAHVIGCYRSKTAYVMEQNEKGKTVPKKVGQEAITKGDSEYEYSVVFDMTIDNVAIVNKTRCSALAGGVFEKPGRNVAVILANWLTSGEAMREVEIKPAPVETEDHPKPVTYDDMLAGWRTKIGEASDVAALDTLLPLLKTLRPETQAALVPLFRERKASLAG